MSHRKEKAPSSLSGLNELEPDPARPQTYSSVETNDESELVSSTSRNSPPVDGSLNSSCVFSDRLNDMLSAIHISSTSNQNLYHTQVNHGLDGQNDEDDPTPLTASEGKLFLIRNEERQISHEADKPDEAQQSMRLRAEAIRSAPFRVTHYYPSPDINECPPSLWYKFLMHEEGMDPQLQVVSREQAPNPGDSILEATNYVRWRELQSGTTSGICFIEKFTSSRGNEYFCDIDEEYLTDRFNLTNLNTEVQYYQYALDLVTDVFDLDCDEDMREQIEKSARHLYGLVHARYIVTNRGLQKMVDKFKKADFGKCPRVACRSQALLPMGQHDVANTSPVKLYCARCEDLYNPKSNRHASIDGAYFGTSFHGIFFQVYPHLIPSKTEKRHEPKLYGFRVHAAAALARWQEDWREKMKERISAEGLETGFEKEDKEDLEDGERQGDDAANEGIDDMFEGPRGLH